MKESKRSIITGTGRYIPKNIIAGADFYNHTFYEKDGSSMNKDNRDVIQKFKDITEIDNRRYACKDQLTSDLGTFAAQAAIDAAGIDKETLDYIIFASNFGDIKEGTNRVDLLPALAVRVKHKLGIANPNCVAYDIIFGCPGWIQAMIQADYYIRSGEAKRILVIGGEILSRITDKHDRDCMIFADGAGAAVVEINPDQTDQGIISHKSQTHALDHSQLLVLEKGNNPENADDGNLYMKMNGRKLYEFALNNVPNVIKAAIDKAGIGITDVKKILVHQANGKMDEAIAKRLFQLYSINELPTNIMPMTISWLGNSSVATVPTLLDLIIKGEMPNHTFHKGDHIVLASVGAGMHINALVYKF